VTTAVDLSLVDDRFRRGLTTLGHGPTRLYLNLTERCSLRCVHCITQAPGRTADRTARDMGLDVVEALRPHLRDVHYLGFPHAGEPLVAPALEPVLRALAQERQGEPTVVHLLTNGLALDGARFRALVGLGVTSWSISVDGMTAGTHDAVRQGSHIARLLRDLEQVLDVRKAECPGVRVGVAWTITAANLGEVEGLVRYAARVGLDWVKLEEVYPVNDAGRELARLHPGQVAAVVRQAVNLGDELGVPVLEHVFDKVVWRCRLDRDPWVARFSRLDGYVNRMDINPCRLPWELACVEPDGDVKPVSFHHPVAGNVLRGGLLAAWDGPVFQEERARSVARRVCAGGPVTCPVDGGPSRW
jgi:MoaA/NifB/PqqE/SkfB family radical SAM enzyme